MLRKSICLIILFLTLVYIYLYIEYSSFAKGVCEDVKRKKEIMMSKSDSVSTSKEIIDNKRFEKPKKKK